VNDTLAGYATRLAGHGITPALVLETGAVTIEADKDRVRQVLSNLIENVMRHARTGGWMEIRVGIDAATQCCPSVMPVQGCPKTCN